MARKRLQVCTALLLLVIVCMFGVGKWSLTKPKVTNESRGFHEAQYNSVDGAEDKRENVQHSDNLTDVISNLPQLPIDSPKLTRFGSDLDFDYLSQCPEDSLMYSSRWKSLKRPKTTRCPKVFIVGAKKGGTTSLYQYLSKHEDFQGIRLNASKWIGETFYFAQRYSSLKLSEYIKLFPNNKMSGDASVDNLLFCKSPERILKTCGLKTKIIILLRHPLKRYVSNFMMRIERAVYTSYSNHTSLSDTTKKEYLILKSKLDEKRVELPQDNFNWKKYRCLFSCCTSMIYEGMYYVFVMNWLCNFPKENILFLNSEEMFAYPVDIYKVVLKFLGLKSIPEQRIKEITSVIYNQGLKPIQDSHQLNDDDIALLDSIYKPFNEGIFELLNWHNIKWSA